MNITRDNIKLFAASVYDNQWCVSYDEFEKDYARITYIKRLINRYNRKKNVNLRLFLNHIICINNVFPGNVALILFAVMDEKDWNLISTFLIFLNYMPNIDFKIDGKSVKLDELVLDGNVLNNLKEL